MPERDPDRLLETFAGLTERAPRHIVVTRREWILRRAAVFVMTSIVIVAVGAAGLLYAPRLAAPPADDRMELPTHRDLAAYPAASLVGRLVRDGDCVYAASLIGTGRDLVVWPSGTAIAEGDGDSLIVDRVGRRIAAIGEPIVLGGGEIPLAHLETLLETEIPAGCSGPYWLASSATSPLGEARAATWRVDPAAALTTQTTRLPVLLTEIECASGQTPEGRIAQPEVAYGRDSIVVTLRVRTWPGDCPSNPEYPYVVELAEPIGNRSLVDGYDGKVRWMAVAEPTPVTPTPSPTPVPSPDAEAEPAPWNVDAAAPIGPDSTSVRLFVRHDSCPLDFETIGSALPAEIAYASDAVAITVPVLPYPDLELCEFAPWEDRIAVPVLIELAEPLDDRTLVDGSVDPPAVRWQRPPSDASLLPTKRTTPWPLGMAFLDGLCRGVGLDGFIAGAPDDPRLVWVENRSGESDPQARWFWPPGFSVRFTEGVEVSNEAGEVVFREGDRVEGACVVGDGPRELSLYGSYVPLEPDPSPAPSRSPAAALDTAESTALADPLLADYLRRHSHSEPVAQLYSIPMASGPYRPAILVTLRFDDFADDYPLGSCDVFRPIDRVIGVAWLVDEAGSEIEARSPIWPPEIRCV